MLFAQRTLLKQTQIKNSFIQFQTPANRLTNVIASKSLSTILTPSTKFDKNNPFNRLKISTGIHLGGKRPFIIFGKNLLAESLLYIKPSLLAENLETYNLGVHQKQKILKILIEKESKLVAENFASYNLTPIQKREILDILIKKEPELVAKKVPDFVIENLPGYTLAEEKEKEILDILIEKKPELVAKHLHRYKVTSSIYLTDILKVLAKKVPTLIAENLGNYKLGIFDELKVIDILIEKEPELVAKHLDRYKVTSSIYLTDILKALAKKVPALIAENLGNYKLGIFDELKVIDILIEKEPEIVAKYFYTYTVSSSSVYSIFQKSLVKKLPGLLSLSFSQIDFLKKSLGYSGMHCFGFSIQGMEDFLLEEQDAFDARLKKIQKFFEEIEKKGILYDQLSPEQLEEEMKTISPGLIDDLKIFFNKVDYYQNARTKYIQFFEKEKRPIILSGKKHVDYIKEVHSVLRPFNLKGLGPPLEIGKFVNVYSENELTDCFIALEEIVKKVPNPNPLAFQIRSINHASVIGYAPIKRAWSFIDINSPSKIQITKNNIGKTIFDGYLDSSVEKDNHNLALTITLYCLKNQLPWSEKIIDLWKKTDIFKKVTEINPRKSTLLTKSFDVEGIQGINLAAAERDVNAVTLFLKNGANINNQTSNGSTPLCTACLENDLSVAKILINAGADMYLENKGFSPLMLACCSSNTEIVKLLIKSGCDTNKSSIPPLIISCSQGDIETTKALIEAGADINRNSLKGFNAFHSACAFGRLEVVRLLLDKGADPLQLTDSEESGLDLAQRYNHTPIVEFLSKNKIVL